MLEVIKGLQKDLEELNKQPMANAEEIQRIKKKIHELKRNNIIGALIENGCEKSWCEKFKTENLRDMLNKILFRDKAELTEEQVLKDINHFKSEWIADADWWWGSVTTYKNAMHGYDINIVHEEETNKIEAIVYALKYSNIEADYLEIGNECLFKFEIKIELAEYERGQILTPIALEEGAPFELSQNYLITEVKEEEREKRTVKIYTLNDRCDFRYTDFEISAFFKKADLNVK